MKTNTYFRRLLFISILILGTITSVTKAKEINIQGTIYKVDTLSHMKIGPGSYFTSLKLYNTSHQLRVYFAHVDATNPYISFNTVVGRDSLIGCERTSTMAIRKSQPGNQYFVGTNGDFFSTSGDVGYPCHGVVCSSQIGRESSNSPHVAFAGNQPIIDLFNFAGNSVTVKGQTRILNGFNRTRYTDEIIMYNSLRGTHTRSNNYGTEIIAQLKEGSSWQVNAPVQLKVVKKYTNKGNNKISPNTVVISGHGSGATLLEQLSEGDEFQVYPSILPTSAVDIPHVTSLLGGDRIILKDGIIQNNDWAARHPRTAMGYTQNKKQVLFCVVDGRGISIGVSTKQLAAIMKEAGAATAINLDGGGSSAIYVKEFGVMNKTSDGKERSVSNGFYAINKAPVDNQLTEIIPHKIHLNLPRYAKYTPSFYGYNQYETLINTKVQQVKLSCPSSLGHIINDTTFVASGENSGTITATLNGLTTKIHVDLTTEITPVIRLEEVIADKAHPYEIEVNTPVGNQLMPIMPQALTWTVENPEICKIEEGKLIGLKTGDTTITGQLGTHQVTQLVHVQIPTDEEIPICDYADFSTWTLKHTSTFANCSISSNELPLDIDFTYHTGRGPYIELFKEMYIFGIPSSVKFKINTGDLKVKKVTATFKKSSDTYYTLHEFSSIPQNQDVTLEVKFEDLLGDMQDRSSYPIQMKGVKFMLESNTSGESYALKIKDYTITYDTSASSIHTTMQQDNTFKYYPNPVEDGRLYICFTPQENESKVNVHLYSLTGEKVYAHHFLPTKELDLNVSNLSSGWYLIQIKTNRRCMTQKVMIK
jgi:hypothetical protein